MHAQAMRPSGGVACYVKNSLAMHFELWKVPSPGSIIWLKSKHRFVQCSGYLFIGLVYQPPRSSTFQQHSDSLPILEQLQYDVAEVMLAGDFNARTGEATDILSPDVAADLLDNTLQPAACMPVLPRRSVDSKVCAFGRSLLSLCMSSDLIIVNGRVQGDEMGAHTCHIS